MRLKTIEKALVGCLLMRRERGASRVIMSIDRVVRHRGCGGTYYNLVMDTTLKKSRISLVSFDRPSLELLAKGSPVVSPFGDYYVSRPVG